MIQAICRWRSHASIDIYARLGAGDYGKWILEVQQQHVDATTSRRLPRLDWDGVIAVLQALPADEGGQQHQQ